MKRRYLNIALPAAAAGLLVLLSACVYAKLLEFKKQLKNFDDNFTVQHGRGVTLGFLNPMLSVKDIRFLIGADPAEVSQGPDGESTDHHEFERVFASSETRGSPLDRLSLDIHYTDPREVTGATVPENFLWLFPAPIVVETLKQSANCQVFISKKLAKGDVKLTPRLFGMLPSLEKTLNFVGDPLERNQKGEKVVLFYRYRVPAAKREVPIKAWLTFAQAGSLERVFVTWDSASVDVHFVGSE